MGVGIALLLAAHCASVAELSQHAAPRYDALIDVVATALAAAAVWYRLHALPHRGNPAPAHDAPPAWVAVAMLAALHVVVLRGAESWRAYVVTRFVLPPAVLLLLARAAALASGAALTLAVLHALGRPRAPPARRPGGATLAACIFGLLPVALAGWRASTLPAGQRAAPTPMRASLPADAAEALLSDARWVDAGGGHPPAQIDLPWPPSATVAVRPLPARAALDPDRMHRRLESALLRGGRILIELPNDRLVAAAMRARAAREGVAARGCWLMTFEAPGGVRRFVALGRDIPAWASARKLAHHEPPRVEPIASAGDLAE